MRGFFRRNLDMTDPVAELQVRRRGMPIDDLIDIADDLDGYQWAVGTDLPMFVVIETARATKTTRAAALLASTGYGPQVLVLARMLTESMFFIRWAVHNPEGVDERLHLHFRLAATVEGEAWSNSGIGKFDSRPNPPLSKTEREQAVEWFGKRGTRLWTSHQSIKDLVQELIAGETSSGTAAATVGALRSMFDLMLGWADRMTHTTGISTASGVQDAPDDLGAGQATTGPSLDEIQQAIMLTQMAFAMILDAVLPHMGPEMADRLTAATSRAWRSHPDIERLTTIGPTERCICDQPNGTWAECHAFTDKYAQHDFEAKLVKAVRLERTRR